jgi:hypothetical protein
MNAGWIIPFIILGGALQSRGICRESVAGVGHLVRADYPLFRRGVADSSPPTPHSEGLGSDAPVGCVWLLGLLGGPLNLD